MITHEITDWQPAPASTARPIFAIGDVHGRLDLLTALHDVIRGCIVPDSDALPGEAGDGAAPLLVHLGDYLDRGPQPLACLQVALRGVAGIETVTLPGNHEQFMARSLSAAAEDDLMDALEGWFAYNCGTAVARELGYGEPFVALDEPERFLARLRRRLGRDLLDRFAALPNHWRHGRYLFVHAGIHPGLDLAAQLAKPWGEVPLGDFDADPLWVRGPFLTHEGHFQEDVVVVHGHTIMRIPQIRHNRIGIDTGAFMTGRLTAVELRGDRLRLITVIGPELPWGH